ncbi:MAG TPA: putative baseplate assembly protein [Planctomycetota bacterium]|nr:putative baseplate assembly protein [Planctomycetota bacterium]
MSTPLDPTLRALDDCGCCAGVAASTPSDVANRPGLSAVAYRIGTWHEFKRSLLAALSASQHAKLAKLATRDDDDFSIALLDAAAVLGDVLTFYQERIANELFLRTATERRSILELARLIGYELRPGVAASALLAFTVEDAAGSPRVATVDVGVKVQSVPGHEEKPQTFETVEKLKARARWNAMGARTVRKQTFPKGRKKLWLGGVATGLKTGDAIAIVGHARVAGTNADDWELVRVRSAAIDAKSNRTRVRLAKALGRAFPYTTAANAPLVLALRTRAALFGHNAPHPKLLPAATVTALHDANELTTGEVATTKWSFPTTTPSHRLALDAAHPSIARGSWVVVDGRGGAQLFHVEATREVSRQKFALAGKVSRLTLDGDVSEASLGASLRGTVVFGQSEALALAERPAKKLLAKGAKKVLLDARVGKLPAGRRLLVTGRDSDTKKAVVEEATVDHVSVVSLDHLTPARKVTRIHFSKGLEYTYVRNTVRVLGNVALATHGETVKEVLGGGDASRRFQAFALRQPPLTWVRDDASASGAASTLEIRVDDLLWREKPSFYGRGAAERVFVSRVDGEGRTIVRFGDGVHGARLPTGAENVRAVYRKGIGVGGNVAAGKLTTLLTRPLGLKGATNPLAAYGGADPEKREAARENAPLTVRTLDRVVSLRDYEDFARAYSGIAKSLATWTWDGERRGVFVTVAGPDGAAVDPKVVGLLYGAIRDSGDPFVPLRVSTYRPAAFKTTFKIATHPDYEKSKVRTASVQALRTRFDFDSRAFGQPVALAEVIAAIQGVAGVVAVDVDSLLRTDGQGGDGLVEPLPAAVPQMTSLGGALAAELLTLSADPIVPGALT